MTHDELLAKINKSQAHTIQYTGLGSEIEMLTLMASRNALRAVVKLHKPVFAIANGAEGPKYCQQCVEGRGYAAYPCPTIQAIEKELK